MKTSIAAVLLGAAAATLTASAQTPEFKPGLWEFKIVKLINDGKDMSDMMTKMQAQIASMPPDQRAMIESRMAASGVSLNGSAHLCISPAMAARHQIGADPMGHCPSAGSTVSGNKISFSVNCTYNGRTTVGSGWAIMGGDSMSTHIDTKTTDTNGTHAHVVDAQMNYLGSDCQGLKPLDQNN